MKKYWEINSATLEDSIKIALKQIQKFAEKKTLKPVKLIQWEERVPELAVGIVFEPGQVDDIVEWINKNRIVHG